MLEQRFQKAYQMLRILSKDVRKLMEETQRENNSYTFIATDLAIASAFLSSAEDTMETIDINLDQEFDPDAIDPDYIRDETDDLDPDVLSVREAEALGRLTTDLPDFTRPELIEAFNKGRAEEEALNAQGIRTRDVEHSDNAIETAYAEGIDAYHTLQPNSNPYVKDSDLWTAWNLGYTERQAEVDSQ